ncbi:protein FAM133A-like [Ruditapes philippinarum]|uniref:protein FAM133A-like n=1 Tax=Ruditapes philippinarum TaxID=129788 RepID=UPI00295AEEB1|nr:protein FAM133A-like [Ruditapes philippinarum]
MNWWVKKEFPRDRDNILEIAMQEAHIVASPEIQIFENETEREVEGLLGEESVVNDDNDTWVETGALDLTVSRRMEEKKNEVVEAVIGVATSEEQALDLRIVRRRDVEVVEKIENERDDNNRNEMIDNEVVLGDIERSSEVRREELDEQNAEESNIVSKPRSRERVRHSLKRNRSVSSSSSSSSSSDESSSSEDEREKRENKFCKIMCDMVKRTGNIIGSQIISNAEMINKLQRTVDELRKEVAELKKEKDSRDGKEVKSDVEKRSDVGEKSVTGVKKSKEGNGEKNDKKSLGERKEVVLKEPSNIKDKRNEEKENRGENRGENREVGRRQHFNVKGQHNNSRYYSGWNRRREWMPYNKKY